MERRISPRPSLAGLLWCGLITLWSAGAAGQEVELAYDDGTPSGGLRDLSAGDIEITRMTPEHPAEVVSIRLHVATEGGCRADFHIWGDNGGNAPDLERELFQAEVDVAEPGWVDVELPDGEVVLEAPQHFYVGHVIGGESPCQLSWDASGGDEVRSMARIGGNWYSIVDRGDPPRPIDALIRATVRYFDVLEDRWFEDVTDEAGLPRGMGRMAWGDFDGDGDDDLLVGGNRLFRNEGDGTFVEITEEAGIGGRPTNGGVWADYDNDGHLDFFATVHNYLPECETDDDCVWCTLVSNPDGSRSCDELQYDHSCEDGRCLPPDGVRPHDLLWHNEGDGTFTEVSEEAGTYDFMPTEAAAWGDYDGDGHVDLYVANYETPGPWAEGRLSVGTPDFLWHNNGDGTFDDVTDAAGLRPFITDHCGRGVAWADHDDDGDLDLYVANYRLDPNYHWENQGDGTFEIISFENHTAGVQISNAYGHGIGASWADFDRDGDWDLFVANLAHPRFIEFSDKSMLYVNQGPPAYDFEDIRESAGITYSETHSDPAWGDFDNDGFEDLFITDVYVGYWAFLYRSNGDQTFTDVTYPSGIAVDNGWGCAWADYDNDGDLDLVTRSLWRNDAPDTGHWLRIRLRGTTSNAAAIGAVVRVTRGEITQMRQVEGGKGTGIQSSLTLHFGLGEAETVDEVFIRWPSGLEESYTDVAADQTLLYWEGGEPPDGDAGPDSGPDAGDAGPDSGDAGPDGGPYTVRGGWSCSSAGPGAGQTLAALARIFISGF